MTKAVNSSPATGKKAPRGRTGRGAPGPIEKAGAGDDVEIISAARSEAPQRNNNSAAWVGGFDADAEVALETRREAITELPSMEEITKLEKVENEYNILLTPLRGQLTEQIFILESTNIQEAEGFIATANQQITKGFMSLKEKVDWIQMTSDSEPGFQLQRNRTYRQGISKKT